MKRVHLTLRIDGMTCAACARHVSQVLQRVPGVVQTQVPGWQAGRAEVIAQEGVDEQALLEVVAQAGYRAEIVRREPWPRPFAGKGATETPAYDLVVLGGGSAGFAAALRAAEEGARVLMVNAGPMGGTCVNRGCVPSKFLLRAMEHYHRAGEARYRGVQTAQGALYWARLVAHKEALVADLRRAKYEDVLAAYPNITYVPGRARLQPGLQVVVNGRVFAARKVVVATGAQPWAPPIPGLEEAGYLTSTTALALREVPRSLIVLGGNAVGLELAQVFARAGAAVTVVELLPRILPFEDEDISRAMAQYLEDEGLRLFTGAQTQEVRRDADGYWLRVRLANGYEAVLRGEQLLVATGRRPNTQDLGLEDLGIRMDRRGAVLVDAFGQTTHPDVYAAGDCANLPQFVYVAAHSGTVAAENALLGNRRTLDVELVPRVIFTDPQVAAVGPTEAQAREQGLQIRTTRLSLEHVPKALTAGDTRGFIKWVAEAETGRLLAAHVVAPEAGEIIQIAALAIRQGLTYREVADMLFPYLTLAEGLKLAAQTFEKDVTKLSCCAG